MDIQKITAQISYLPASEQPLSADVGIIRTDKSIWIYDVGSNKEAADLINGISKENGLPKNVVLSHFHQDHSANINNIAYNKLYGGGFTCKHFGKEIAIDLVDKDMFFEDGVHLFPIPSSHAKGCAGLEYGDYAFLGDSTYSCLKDGKIVYNSGQLKALIDKLKSLNANNFLLSHNQPFICSKDDVISELCKIYGMRERDSAYIVVNT